MQKKKAVTIAITSQKGGVAKSSTTNYVAYDLALSKKKILLIDYDPQASQTNSFLGLKDIDYIGDHKSNIVRIFTGEQIVPLKLKSLKSQVEFDFIPANDELLDVVEGDSMSYNEKIKKLSIYIKSIEEDYDYIIIDAPPSFGILTKSVLLASDTILVPIATRSVDENGVFRYFEKTNSFIEETPDCKVSSMFVLPTIFDRRMRNARDMLSPISLIPRLTSQMTALKNIVCKTLDPIPYKVEILEAPGQRMFLREYVEEWIEDKKALERINPILLTLSNVVREITTTEG